MGEINTFRRTYLGAIYQSAKSIVEGLAVTFTEYLRSPGKNHTTVQYPDRTAVPVVETLPERYRGFLEVDMDICTACKACERDCPINCIVIDVEKVEGVRAMTRFDIDLGKCMYCGICVDACPTDAQAPGDVEATKCIRMTREFEGVTPEFDALTFRFVRPGDKVVPFKVKKGETPPTRARGEIAREARKRAAEYNALAAEKGRALARAKPSPLAEEVAAGAAARAKELEALVKPIVADDAALADLILRQTAQTDCEDCAHATCREYARALVSGEDQLGHKCAPGGPATTRDIHLILELRAGKPAAEAAKLAAERTLEHHKGP